MKSAKLKNMKYLYKILTFFLLSFYINVFPNKPEEKLSLAFEQKSTPKQIN